MRNVIVYRILTVITGLLLLASTIFVIVSWSNVPDSIPTHFNFAGEADDYGGKGSLIFMMVIAWIVFIGITILMKFPNTWNMPVKVTSENKNRLYGITRGMLEIIKMLSTLLFVVMFVSAAIAASMPQWIIIAILAAIIITCVIGTWLMFKNR